MSVPAAIRPLDRPGDLGWVVMANGERYATEFGWNRDYEPFIARLVADLAGIAGIADRERNQAWIAELTADASAACSA